ncbi:hypothetical protein [Polaribacter sp. Asnod1-A03]|uniref:hypothetical protein n=1 Tax=Polaribacter sp. Asnod1-A03 TaxID=3160581 RepID=UPI00386D1AFC
MDILDTINKTTNRGSESSKKYLETFYEHGKLKIFQLVTVSLSSIVKVFLIGWFIFIGLIFLAFASAIFLGNYLNNISLGYLIVALFFLIISLLIFSLRKRIDKKIIRKMSDMFFES